jgi:hypothetical protein
MLLYALEARIVFNPLAMAAKRCGLIKRKILKMPLWRPSTWYPIPSRAQQKILIALVF